jgi:hypothetical protein
MQLNKILLIMALFVAETNAQVAVRISGYVTDAETGERISGANVRMGADAAVSNSYGYYSLKTVAGKTTITASCVGYSPYDGEVEAKGDTVVPIALKPGIELAEIVVEHAGRKIENRGLGNMRVNLSQLYLSPLFWGERDIIKSMQILPGVSDGMEGSSNLIIRGGTNDQTLYLMDDVPVYNQNHTFGLVSIFNPDALLSADIYKGGIPAAYGNRLSGVASIALKDGNMKSHKQSFGLALMSGTLSAEGPVVRDRLSYLFTARRSFLDLLLKGIFVLPGGNYTVPSFAFWDVNGKIVWKLSGRSKLTAGVYSGYDDIGVMNSEKRDGGYKVSDRAGTGWQTTSAFVRLTSDIRPDMFLSSNIYYSQYDNFDFYRINVNGVKSRQSHAARLQETGWRTLLEYRPSNSQTLNVGADFSRQLFHPDLYIENGNRIDLHQKRLLTATVSVDDEIKPAGGWIVAPGLRASYYSSGGRHKTAVEPRLKLSKFTGANDRLMLAYDRMTQPVHSLYEMSYTVKTDFWLPFNSDNLPVSDQVSAGWKNYALRDFTFSVEAYFKRLRNLIYIKDMERFLDYNEDFSTGRGTSRGIEVMAQYNRRRLGATLSYTLSKTDRTFDSRTVPFKYDTPHDLELFAGYEIYKKARQSNTLSLNVRYHTGMPFNVAEITYPAVPHPELANYNDLFTGSGTFWHTWYKKDVYHVEDFPNIRMKDYLRIDLNFTAERKAKHGKKIWQFSLMNATNSHNPYNVFLRRGRYKSFVMIPFFPSIAFRREF